MSMPHSLISACDSRVADAQRQSLARAVRRRRAILRSWDGPWGWDQDMFLVPESSQSTVVVAGALHLQGLRTPVGEVAGALGRFRISRYHDRLGSIFVVCQNGSIVEDCGVVWPAGTYKDRCLGPGRCTYVCRNHMDGFTQETQIELKPMTPAKAVAYRLVSFSLLFVFWTIIQRLPAP
ncbi:hypothetical protein FB451DRAFT_576613 [Mycena latifolia]|nr:hypothetical protein FB451DRAFT_576613 [Mycena latifolia]